ncbi:hypothetical protein GCM10009422_09850 [Brevundimonas kwangchunensis]|uniref:Lectin-like protein BA14k n=1 Tax=Brevundimonas kwangchunensis TaxID=322163 RepID=A0ABP3RTD2_9CAUL
MRRPILLALAASALLAAPAAAQSWGRYDGGYSPDSYSWSGEYRYTPTYSRGSRGDWNAVPSDFDWRSQLDRPGDYRCDQYWDANRTDCADGWRDQRHRVSRQARSDYRSLAGYRASDGYGYRGHGYGYAPRRGYGSRYYGYGHASGGTSYEGAYGRPDVVYPSGGAYGDRYGSGGRDARRIEWCRWSYRSYDPASGYYRAYSGRLVWCG